MKSLPFYALLIMTFGLAGIEKLAGGKVPDWFLQQFKGSLLDFFPGALTMAFFFLALMEGGTFLLLMIGILRKEFLQGNKKKFLVAGVIGAQLTFVALSFGQRLTHQYEAAGSLFFYAVLTFIAGQFALAEK